MPTTPTVDTRIYEGGGTVTGIADPGVTVFAMLNGEEVATTTADKVTGAYSLTINGGKAKETIYIIAENSAGRSNIMGLSVFRPNKVRYVSRQIRYNLE